jgi:hypothetical protein
MQIPRHGSTPSFGGTTGNVAWSFAGADGGSQSDGQAPLLSDGQAPLLSDGEAPLLEDARGWEGY